MITNATEFLRECRKNKAFKNAIDAIDNQHIIDFAEAYAELRLSNVVGQSEQLSLCQCEKPSPDIMYGKTCVECCLEIGPKA